MERPWPRPSAFLSMRRSCSRNCSCSGEKSKFMVVLYEVGGWRAPPLGAQLVERHFPIDPCFGRQSKHAFRKNVAENLVSSTADPERRAPVPSPLHPPPLSSHHRPIHAAQPA